MKERLKDDTETPYKRGSNMMATFKEREPTVVEYEVRRTLKELENGKAPGVEKIPIELLKVVREEAIKI